MKTWRIPVSYRMVATVTVEANTLEEAIEIARDEKGIIPIPDNAAYLDDSWEVDYTEDKEYIRELFNNNQEDTYEDYKNFQLQKIKEKFGSRITTEDIIKEG